MVLIVIVMPAVVITRMMMMKVKAVEHISFTTQATYCNPTLCCYLLLLTSLLGSLCSHKIEVKGKWWNTSRLLEKVDQGLLK